MKTNLIFQTYSNLIESINCFFSIFCTNLERFLKFPQSLEHILVFEHIYYPKIVKHFFPMNMILQTLPTAMLLLCVVGCSSPEVDSGAPAAEIGQTKIPRFDYQRSSNGKIKFASQQPEIFAEASLDSLDFPEFNEKLVTAIESQLDVLKKTQKQ